MEYGWKILILHNKNIEIITNHKSDLEKEFEI